MRTREGLTMFRRIALISVVVISICGCASQQAIDSAQASADVAMRDSAVAKSTAEAARASAEHAAQAAANAQDSADSAIVAAHQALATAEETRYRMEQFYQTSAGPPPGPPGEEILVPNSEYVSHDEPYYRVWYGTNRALNDSNRPEEGFSNRDGRQLIYGRAVVFVPQSHKFGETGSSWIVRRLFMREDDRLKIENIEILSEDDFRFQMASKLLTRFQGKRTALVYIHGYNTNFDDAIIRAAQIGYDLKVEGITAVFSWPSAGSLFAYTADEATIQASEVYLEEFLKSILSNPEVENLNILAHSMGNRALMRVMNSFANDTSLPAKPINQIILAAPDVDVRIFEELAKNYSQLSTRTTLYVSARDKALDLSGWLHRFQRLGKGPPITVISDIDTIAVDEIDISTLGHAYFADAEALLYDIFHLLKANANPDDRQRLQSTTNQNGQKFWFFAK